MQMTLGDLIDKFEEFAKKNSRMPVRIVPGEYPTSLDSYRGYYDQLALGYDRNVGENYNKPTVKAVLRMLRKADGKYFEGWKGGAYEMDRSTPVWLDDRGECHNEAITDAVIVDDEVMLVTEMMGHFFFKR